VSKAIITLDFDETGRLRAVVLFDPPLPERPGDPDKEVEWLELLEVPQLAAFIIMDEIVDMFGDEDVEISSVVVGKQGHDPRH